MLRILNIKGNDCILLDPVQARARIQRIQRSNEELRQMKAMKRELCKFAVLQEGKFPGNRVTCPYVNALSDYYLCNISKADKMVCIILC